MTPSSRLPGTDKSLIGWMLAEDNVTDGVEALYPGIRAVQIRLEEHKFTPLPAEASKGDPGYNQYKYTTACVVRRPLHGFILVQLFDRILSA